MLQDGHHLGELLAHRLERDALVGLQRADQPAGVLGGKEAFRDDGDEHHVHHHRRQQGEQNQPAMVQRPGERAAVELRSALTEALAPPQEVGFGALGAKEQGAQHRRRGQRDHHRHQDRHRERDGELAEQPADDAAHEQDGQEHRDQRQRDRDDGEADFLGPAQRRLRPRHTILDIAGDVLQHDNGVIDHEASRDRQRHEREIVQAVASQIHRAEGADHRHGDGDQRYQRCPQISQEDKHHQRDQGHGNQQRHLRVGQRGPDAHRAVGCEAYVDIVRQRCLQLWHRSLDCIHG